MPTNRLPALSDVDVLNGHLLLATATVSLQRLHLSCEGARKFVEGIRGAVLLRDILDMRQASSEGHRGIMDGGHLGGEQCFGLIARFDPLDHREHEIDGFSREDLALCWR